MGINVKSKFGLHSRNSFFVILILVLLISPLFIGVFAPKVEGQTANSWNTGDTYNIVYITNGGVVNTFVFSYNTGNIKSSFSLPLSIPDPVRHEYFPRDYDYEFLGWTVTYTNGTQVHSQKSYVIPEGTTGDINLEAKWASKGFWQSIKDGGLSIVVIIAAIVVLLFVGIFVLALFSDHRDRWRDAYERGDPVPIP